MKSAILLAALLSASGSVDIRPAGTQNWSPAAAGQELRAGDGLRTGAGSSAALVFSGGSKLLLRADSSLLVESASTSAAALRAQAGFFEAWAKPSGPLLRLRTGAGEAALRKGHLLAHVDASGAASWDVFDGKARLTGRLSGGTTVGKESHMALDSRGELSPAEYLLPGLSPSPEPK